MSLEQTIADLVAASNNLTGTINSKMGEIDQGLSEGLGDLEKKISAGFSGEDRYCSPIGSDSSGDGSAGNPFRTIKKAVDSMYRNGVIWLVPGEYYWSGMIDLQSRDIVLRSTTEDYADTTIFYSKKEDGSPTDNSFFRLYSSSVTVERLTLSSAGQLTEAERPTYRRAFVFAENGASILRVGNVGPASNTSGLVVEKSGDILCRVARSFLQVSIYKVDMECLSGTATVSGSGAPYVNSLCFVDAFDRGTLIASTPNSTLTNIDPVTAQYIGGIELAEPAA